MNTATIPFFHRAVEPAIIPWSRFFLALFSLRFANCYLICLIIWNLAWNDEENSPVTVTQASSTNDKNGGGWFCPRETPTTDYLLVAVRCSTPRRSAPTWRV